MSIQIAGLSSTNLNSLKHMILICKITAKIDFPMKDAWTVSLSFSFGCSKVTGKEGVNFIFLISISHPRALPFWFNIFSAF